MDEEQKRMLEELVFSGEEKLSFAKLYYFGIFHSPSCFPYPKPTKEEKKEGDEYLKKVAAFVDTEVDADAIDRNAEIPDTLIKGLADLGLLGMTIPKEYGGLGMSQHYYCRATELLARKCGSTALFVNAHQSIGMKALLLYGNQKQKDTYLPPLARGELLAAFSLTEPTAGSDASGVKTRATYDPEKKVYRINGEKQWTTNGSIADLLTVMAQTPVETERGTEEKITAFLVKPSMKGFTVKDHALEKVGMRGTKTANLIFDNVEVPEENILGPKGKGLKVCLTVLDYGRTTFGATCTGAAKYCVERAFDHAINRQQFNRSLASFPLVKRKLAIMRGQVFAMDAMTYLTAGLVDKDQDEFMLEAAMLKVFASDCSWSILYDTMQIFGGRSFFNTEPFERMMRDARLNMIGEGANEVLQAFIALVGIRDLGLQLKGIVDAMGSPIANFNILSRFFGGMLERLKRPSVPVRSYRLQKEAKILGSCIRSFSFKLLPLLGRHGEGIVEKQLVLDRVATIATRLYAMSATISKMDSILESQKDKMDPQVEKELEVVKFYIAYARDEIQKAQGSFFWNMDKKTERLSDLLTGV